MIATHVAVKTLKEGMVFGILEVLVLFKPSQCLKNEQTAK